MKTKHTKGPWKTSWMSKYPQYDFVIDVPTGQTICQLFSKWEDEYQNQEANAKLIAAAPDLLEACINSMKTFISIGCTNEAEIMQQLESAIKKATE